MDLKDLFTKEEWDEDEYDGEYIPEIYESKKYNVLDYLKKNFEAFNASKILKFPNPKPENPFSIINSIISLIKNDYVTKEIIHAEKEGYVQGVSYFVAKFVDDHTLGKKILSEMNVTKDMAKKFANPETYKNLEQGIFAQKQELQLEQTQGIKR